MKAETFLWFRSPLTASSELVLFFHNTESLCLCFFSSPQMPGTIQISVLDIVDLPPPPAPPSSTFIRVTMGRREYQATENGDFSIPLTTLREKLIVELVNRDGHVISHTTGVETRLVVEKGVWNEVLHLEGGGQMHLKMEFVLSEEEQSRIRMMRLSALKKKHGELVNDSSTGPHKAAAAVARDAATSSPRTTDEISKSGSTNEEGPAPNVLTVQNAAKSDVTKAKDLIQMQKPEGSIAAEPDHDEILRERERRSRPDAAATCTSARSAIPSLRSNVEEHHDGAQKVEMRGSLEKTRSNVRKMISTFETHLIQDKRPRIKPPPTRPKPSNREMEDLMGSSQQPKEEHADERSPGNGRLVGAATEPDSSSSSSGRALAKENPNRKLTQEGVECLVSSKNDKVKPLSYCENMEEYYSSREGSREWIFLDDQSNVCVTAGGKKMMHRMEEQSIETKNSLEGRDVTIPYTPLVKQVGVTSKANIKVSSRGRPKAESGCTAEGEPLGGPFGQAIKIAVMVGFGALVLFTRQKKDR